MLNISIRLLKSDTSTIIHNVRDAKVEYLVSYKGEPAAIISPLKSMDYNLTSKIISNDELISQLDALGAEIDAAWQSEKTAVELLSEQRR